MLPYQFFKQIKNIMKLEGNLVFFTLFLEMVNRTAIPKFWKSSQLCS